MTITVHFFLPIHRLPSYPVVLGITIDGDTKCAFTENVEQRFLSYGWQVLHVANGDRYVTFLYISYDFHV